ncbi:MAG: glycosyltransferase, partial [Acidobacteriota bacterium]
LQRSYNVAVADSFIVWNQMMKNHLLRIFPDVNPENVSVIGAPRLDYFWHSDQIPSKETLYRFLRLENVKRPLIHFSTTELYPMDYVLKAVHEAMQTGELTGNPYLYASVHPGGTMKRHQDLEKYGARLRYSFGRQDTPLVPAFSYTPTEADMYLLVALFKYAAVLVNHSSSTALESLIAGTPVINVAYGRPFDWWRWYRSMVYRDFKQHYNDLIKDGATCLVKNKHQLVDGLKEALANPRWNEEVRHRTVKRMITTTDGTASQQVLAEIMKRAQA